MMGIKRIVLGVMAACALCVGLAAQDEVAGEVTFETGKVIRSVSCRVSEAQTFALYLPKKYNKERAWPILYAFDPAARGAIPVELFSQAAERYGYIVVGSNNSKNGPREPVIEAMSAIWHETHRLFNIDNKRVYVTGFSGGARVSTFFYNVARSPVAGIIACGAGLSQLVTPERVRPSLYYGIVGTADFNYREMTHLDQLLDNAGVSHAIRVYEGSHTWPPEDVCLQAIQWMEAMAVRQHIAAVDDDVLQAIFDEEMSRARQLETGGKIAMAASAYRIILGLFPKRPEAEGIRATVARLEGSKDYKTFLKREEARKNRELSIVANLYKVLSSIYQDDPAQLQPAGLLNTLKLDSLKKSARSKDIYEQGLGLRQLYNLATQARTEAGKLHQKHDYLKAIVLYEIALEAGGESPYRPYDYYNLACAFSCAGEKKKALKNLDSAVDAGFDRLETLQTDPDLNAVRGEPGFAAIAAKIKQGQVD